MMPRSIFPACDHLLDVRIPEAFMRKYPNASREWPWQFLFPSATLCPHPRTGRIARYHVHEASMQRQFKDATRKARLSKPATCHTLRHSFLPNQRVRTLDAGRAARQTIEEGRQPALGLLSKAAGGDRPPFIALTRGSGGIQSA